jgi:excinuclease UvrABC nuclease subunit
MSIYKPGRPSKYNPFTKEGSKPPKAPGEYRLRNSNGVITYVGETNDLSRRANEHKRNGKLSDAKNFGGTFEWKKADRRSTSATRREHERQKIAQHKPALNRSVGGEGRIAKRR